MYRENELTPTGAVSRPRPPKGPDGYFFDGNLKPHQRAGVEWLWERRKTVLADDPGLGKTIQALALIGRLEEDSVLLVRSAKSACRVLWLTDSALIKQTKQEIERFLPTFTVLACPDPEFGSEGKWRKALDGPRFDGCPDILVMSYEMALSRRSWLSHTTPALLVLDEATKVKGGKQAYERVREIAQRTDFVLAMTATPLENDPMELYRLMRAADIPGLWPEGVFKHEFVTWKTRLNQRREPELVPDGWQESRLPEVQQYLEDVMIQRSAAGIGLTLPIRVGESYRLVALSPVQQKAYDDAAQSTGAKEAAGRYSGADSVLVDALMELLEELGDEQSIVYCESIDVLDLAAQRLTQAGISFARIQGDVKGAERATAVEAHRTGEARVLLGSRVLERGLNLQHCRVLISLDASWNPAREKQREGRICRIGSPHETYRHITLLPDTPLSHARLATLSNKDATARAIKPTERASEGENGP